jgi:plastocyanin
MRFRCLAGVAGLSAIVACGGSGGDGTTTPPPPQTVQSISLSRTSALIEPTETVTITATPRDGSGNPVSGKTVTWLASPSGTVTLTPNGNSVTVTGSSLGSAQVTATVDQVTSPAANVNVTNSIPLTGDVSVGNGGDLFSPNQLDLKAGGTVTYTWFGTHNVTFGNTPATVPNSGNKNSGDTFQVTFPQAGVYSYQCTLHPGMTGSVTVHP